MRFRVDWLCAAITATSTIIQGGHAHSQAPPPIRYLSPLDNVVIHTPSHRIHSYSSFDITFTIHNHEQPIKLKLEPNHDVLAEDAEVQYLNADGTISHTENIDRRDHRVFKGSAWTEIESDHWTYVGWARLYVKRDGPNPLFEGTFSLMHDYHNIKLRSSYLRTRSEHDVLPEEKDDDYMVVFRNSDMYWEDKHTELKRSLPDPSCRADQLDFNSDPNHPVFRPPQPENLAAMPFDQLLGLSRRQSDTGGVGGNTGGINLASTIGDTSGCPKNKLVALVGVATDCNYLNAFNGNQSAARADVISMFNSASSVYESTFNISLGLKNLTMQPAQCPDVSSTVTPWNMPCASGNISSRLSDFTAWRGDQNDSNAYWTLMTNCPTDSEVGVSWLGQLCVHGSSNASVAGANVVVKTATEWQVFAHETGHTFGAVHDCDSTTCQEGLQTTSQCCPFSSSTCSAGGKYIMNPSTGPDIEHFSQCTVGNICSALGRNSVQSNCLVNNKDVTTYTGSQCGNGIVETGEECDCGGTAGCGNDPCCDPTTCKFKNNAVCDDSNEACCSGCQFMPANTTCRASTGPCDIAETCSGTSGTCPPDQYVPDGKSCTSGNVAGLTCASGQCTSRDLQCRTILGTVLGSNDTYACDQSSCTLWCASSKLPSNECGSMQQNFLDGTPCNGDGHCNNGQCVGSSVGGEIKSWVDQHKPLVIGLAAGIGGLIVLMILSCIVSACRRRRFQKKFPGPAAPGGRRYPGYQGPPPPGAHGWSGPMPPAMQQNGTPAYGAPPPYPPYPPMGYENTATGGLTGSQPRYA